MPPYTNKGEAEQALSEWEQTHLEQCERKRDAGQFFGFKEVGEAHLERYTKFLFVPSVRDASEDAIDSKGSVISEIMDRAVIIGTATAMGHDLKSRGVSVIPCMGKTCFDRPIAIFRSLDIPVYAIMEKEMLDLKIIIGC